MPLSTYLQNKLLDALLRSQGIIQGSLWLSLHRADPGSIGAAEFSGGGYRRYLVAFHPAQAGITSNEELVDFPDMPMGNVAGFGLWDSREGGQFLGGGTFLDVRDTQAGDTYRIPRGNIRLSIGA